MIKYLNCKLIVIIVFLLSLQNTQAQNNWDGDNATGRLNTPFCDNWFGDLCPATWNSTTDLNIQFKNSILQTTMYLDFGTWKDINNLVYFNTYTSSVTQFDADGPIGNENGLNFYGKIENNSPNLTQIFNLPFHGKNAAVIELNPISGGLTFNRPIYNSGNKNFNVYGSSSKKVTLNDYPEGNGSVGFYLKQYSIVEVNYSNPASLSGGYFVEEGELWVNSGGVIQGGIQVGNSTVNTAKLYISHISTPTTVANAITVPANSTNATIGSLNTSNLHTYTGTINLNNNAVNFDVVSAGGSLDFTNVISGTGGIKKISPGLVRLSASNTYTGNTVVTQGTLQYGVANAIANTSNVILNGGKYSTGAAAGFSDTVGTLALTDNSIIELGTGNNILTFANSNAVAWTAGKTLTITGWTNSCTGAKVFVGNNNTGLTATQLTQITFSGYAPGASISSTGELIPGNVVLTATVGTLIGNYATLKAAFDAINLSTHTGVIAISVLNDTNEGVLTAALNQVAGVTSVSIQPGGCGARTITGATTAPNPLIDFNGADNVTVDGLNTGGNSLTISNTTVSATSGTCTIRFQADAINNTVTNTTVLGSATMASGTAGGNIFFGAASTVTGSDNNTISNCTIGPAGVNLPTKGICFTGSPGFENSGTTITNNNIYDYFSSIVASAGIDLATIGSNTASITNNRFYQTATRTLNATAIHSGIRIANTAATATFVVTGNTIGYSSSAGTGTYTFIGTVTGAVFNPINLTLGATASSIQNNTIAGIAHSTSFVGFFNLFNAINVTAGAVNIGTVTGNTIGLAAAPITFSCSVAGGGTITGINTSSASTVNIQNNTVQSISSSGIATAAFDFNGINVAGAGVYTINNNTIGHSVAANSINIGTLGTSTALSTVRGINSTVTGTPLNIGASGLPNVIQNITMNANAANIFTGISTSGANTTTNISYNSLRGVRFASASTTGSNFTGISNSGAVTANITIGNNNLGIAGTDLVTYTAANSGLFRGISNSGGTGAAALSILSNDFRGITHTVAANAVTSHNFIINTGATLSQDISSNTFTNLSVNTTGGIVFFTNSVSLGATGTKNMNSNSIVGTFTKVGATGALTLYLDVASSVAGAIINNNNNNLSNITVSGTTAVTGWHNTDGATPCPTKTITGNNFSTWALGSSAVVVMNVNFLGGATSSVSSNIISGITSTGAITGLTIGVNGTATTLSVNSNNISTLNSSGAGGAVTGISNGQPATTLTNNTNVNTISGLSSTANSVVGITSTSASPTKTISNNNISTLSNAGAIVGISTSGGTTVTIDTNTINTISSTAVGGALVLTAINVNGGSAISVTNNPISALSSANDGAFRGIYINPLGATSNTITGNTINGMTSSSATTSSSLRAIEVQGTNNASISSNTISNINSATTNVAALGVSTPIVALYYGSSGAASTISSNTISAINATSAGAINVSLAAMVTASTAAGGTISKNRIYGLTNTTTGATNYTTGFVPNGGSWTFANNMISITNNNTTQCVGTYDSGATGARNYYYNSIYIGGAHAGTQVSAAFQFNAAAGTADIKNNIFAMARTSGGKNYAIVNTSSSFTGITINYNVLNATVASTIGLSNATDTSFLAWKTASGGDANSYTAILLPFTSTATADLHLSASCTDVESGGTPVSVTDDYDTATRNVTTPDIGADEFTGSKPAVITLTPDTAICIGSGTSLTASSTDLTYVYTWSPSTGLSATTGATVTASPLVNTTYTVTGTSPASCVKTKDVSITVNPLPTAITVTPSTVNICANTIQTFVAAPNTGTVTVGTASGSSVAANTSYRQGTTTEVRIQYLFTKAELNGAGITGGNITSIAFNVTTAGTIAMGSYAISMANTPATVLTSTYLTPTFTNVFSTVNLLPVLGLNTHVFSSPFVWDGTSNVVINICHTGTSGVASTVSVSTPAVVSTISRTGSGSCASLTGTTNANRPIITFGFELPITWSPTANLFIDSTASTAYNPVIHLNQPTIYAKVPGPVVYTATVTTPITGCTRTSTGTITMSASVWDGSMWTPAGIPSGNTSLSFTGSYTSSGNLSGCSCSVTGGNVIFNDPDALILTNGLTVTAPGTLKFNNNSSLVQTNDAATNSGIITMERITPPIYRFDYTYWGTPVTFASNFTLGLPLPSNGLSPDTLSDKFYSWIPTISNGMGNWFSESAATVMDPIKGYIVRGPQTYSFTSGTKIPYPAYFIGTPNNGVISCPIYHGTLGGADDTDDWNLLGNPYPSAVSAAAFLGNANNTPIIDGTIYFWTHNSSISASYLSPFYGTYVLNYNNSDYASWNRVGPVGSAAGTGGPIPNGYIAAGQGFFTKSTTTAPTGNSVIFNNSMRVAGSNSQFYRLSSPPNVSQENNNNDPIERHRIWLNLTNEGGSFNQILIGYVEGATLGLDRDFDGARFTDATSTTLYSSVDDKKLVIQGRPVPFDETDQVPLGYRSNIHDTFTFAIDRIDALFENQNIYIEDRDLNIIHNLKISPYTFISEAGTFNDRFVLRYTDTTLSTNPFDANQNVNAFIANHELQIKSSKNMVNITLYDISGKLIQAYSKEMGLEFKTKFNFANGVYLAKIKLDNGIEVTKKIIH